MTRTTRFLLTTAALFVATTAYAASDYVILDLDGKQVKKSEVNTIWQGLFPQGEAPDFDTIEEPVRQNVLRGVISEYLLYDEAVKSGVDKKKEVEEKVEEARRKITVRHFLDDKTKNMVSNADVKAEYDRLVKEGRDKEEVRARHILVESEEKAKELKKKLDGGADFEALAKDNSTDPGSKAQGGDLGYFTEERMVPEFSKAAFATKKGEISEPVKSSFGWHVIKVEDRRKITIPTFNDVRESLQTRLSEKKLNDYVNRLVDQTDVKYFGSNGKEKDLTKVPDSSKE